jgi:YggT family protein
MCDLGLGFARVISIYTLIMIVYAIISWIPDLRGRWTDYVAMLVDPVLAPVRRLIPPVAGLDLSFLIVIILLQVLSRWIASSSCSYF